MTTKVVTFRFSAWWHQALGNTGCCRLLGFLFSMCVRNRSSPLRSPDGKERVGSDAWCTSSYAKRVRPNARSFLMSPARLRPNPSLFWIGIGGRGVKKSTAGRRRCWRRYTGSGTEVAAAATAQKTAAHSSRHFLLAKGRTEIKMVS